jgi:hypothetical protein
VTEAPATGAPDGSVTDPVITPVACCARMDGAINSAITTIHAVQKIRRDSPVLIVPLSIFLFFVSGSGSRQS